MSERYTKKRVLRRALSDAVLWSQSFIEANTTDEGVMNWVAMKEACHVERVRALMLDWFGSDRTTMEQMTASLDEECERVSICDVAAHSPKGAETQRASEPPQHTENEDE